MSEVIVNSVTIARNNKAVTDKELKAILDWLEAATKVNDEGHIVFQLLNFEEVFEILPDAFNVRPSAGRRETINLFRKAFINVRKRGSVTVHNLQAEAEEALKKRRASPNVQFTLWTKFRSRQMALCPQFRLNWEGVHIRSHAYLPHKLRLEEYFINGLGRIDPNTLPSYGFIVAGCCERDERSAVEKMMNAIELFFGIANIIESSGKWYHRSGTGSPDGRFWAGPHQFVFQNTKFLGQGRIWFNPDFDEDVWDSFALTMNETLSIVPQIRKMLNKLRFHSLREVIVKSILLMQDGFATRDGSHRLLRYWAALEKLYVEKDAKGRSNEKVIQRATFAEPNIKISRLKLEHIARIRNEHVHSGGVNDDLFVMTQHLRILLTRHLMYWTLKGAKFRSHDELLEFVDFPNDRAQILAMRNAIDDRLKMTGN